MKILNKGLCECSLAVAVLLVLLCNGCSTRRDDLAISSGIAKKGGVNETVLVMSPPWTAGPVEFFIVKLRDAKKIKPPSQAAELLSNDYYKIGQQKAREAKIQIEGEGSLSKGSIVSSGVLDGDEELQVLDKIKKIEKRLNIETEKQKDLTQDLEDLRFAKEEVERELEDARNKYTETKSSLTDDIRYLETQNIQLKETAIDAEQKLKELKKELLKSQIAETKAQQELYKYKVEQLGEKPW